MAGALLLTRPSLLAGAILFRPLSPFSDDLPHRLGWHASIDHRR
jgi:phospholipase/carboxylesterase